MFQMQSDYVTEVLVQGHVSGQDVDNYFQYRSEDVPSGPGTDDSVTWLTNFRTVFRSDILAAMYDLYIVRRYWIRQIRDVVLESAGPPAEFKSVRSDELDYLDGEAGDVGALAAGVGNLYLPVNAALRVKKNPQNFWKGYFKSNYNRFAPWTKENLSTATANDHDIWLAAFITTMNTAFSTFNGRSILGQVGGNGWKMGLWSPNLYGRVFKPVGLTPRQSMQKVATYKANPYIGTQITRRYKPSGAFRGS